MARLGTSSVRARGAGAGAVALVALALAGCGTTGSANTTTGVTASGSTLSIALADPPAVRDNPSAQDVFYGEQLAFAQKHAIVTDASLSQEPLTGSVSDNARTAIADDSLLAYVGEIPSGQSVQTVGITNAEDVLELSPTDTVRPTKDNFEDDATYGETFASLPLDLGTSASALQAAVPGFASAFTAAFRHGPSAQAIEGYDAVWVLLRVIAGLGHRANNRAKIAADVIATLKQNRGRASVANFSIVTK